MYNLLLNITIASILYSLLHIAYIYIVCLWFIGKIVNIKHIILHGIKKMLKILRFLFNESAVKKN